MSRVLVWITPTGWEAQGVVMLRTANGQSPSVQAYVICST